MNEIHDTAVQSADGHGWTPLSILPGESLVDWSMLAFAFESPLDSIVIGDQRVRGGSIFKHLSTSPLSQLPEREAAPAPARPPPPSRSQNDSPEGEEVNPVRRSRSHHQCMEAVPEDDEVTTDMELLTLHMWRRDARITSSRGRSRSKQRCALKTLA